MLVGLLQKFAVCFTARAELYQNITYYQRIHRRYRNIVGKEQICLATRISWHVTGKLN